MIKKSLRNAVAATAIAGTMVLPAATTVAPQIADVACAYPNSVTTATNIAAPTVIKDHTSHTATVDVDPGAAKGRVRFRIVGPLGHHSDVQKNVWAQYDGSPVSFSYGGAFKAGKNYKLKAKFYGNCKFRNSSDALVVTVVQG